jgi:hypothetical protein
MMARVCTMGMGMWGGRLLHHTCGQKLALALIRAAQSAVLTPLSSRGAGRPSTMVLPSAGSNTDHVGVLSAPVFGEGDPDLVVVWNQVQVHKSKKVRHGSDL